MIDDLQYALATSQRMFVDLQYAHATLQRVFVDLQYAHATSQRVFVDLQYAHVTLQRVFVDLQYAHVTLQRVFDGLQYAHAILHERRSTLHIYDTDIIALSIYLSLWAIQMYSFFPNTQKYSFSELPAKQYVQIGFAMSFDFLRICSNPVSVCVPGMSKLGGYRKPSFQIPTERDGSPKSFSIK